jgi:rfaE bifunctional protein kinase chain/domain
MDEIGTYRALVDNFTQARIAVVGDIVADIYIFGKPHRLSREAPVIVVRHESEKMVPGSAANTAYNLMALGATVDLIGVVGDDPVGRAILDFFDVPLARTAGIIMDEVRHTITKTRIMAGDVHTTKQQVIRIDREPSMPMHPSIETQLCRRLEAVLPEVDGIIVSDYGYDVLGSKVTEVLKTTARGKRIVVDSRDRLRELRGVTLATPNESEAEAAAGITIESDADAVEAGTRILNETGNDAILMTRGNRGMMLFEKGVPAETIPICGGEEIVDVSGAGDTVAAVVSLGMAAGATVLQAAHLANYAAGIVVMKSGTATTTRPELMEFIEQCSGGDEANR